MNNVLVLGFFVAIVVFGIGIIKFLARPERLPIPPRRRYPGNQRVIEQEAEVEPDTSNVVAFPERKEVPFTDYEDFNQRLFILEEGPVNLWPEVAGNDYPTVIQGSLDWVRKEIVTRLRPAYPTILDTHGWWAEASDMLEMSPAADHPVISAYLRFPIEWRPVVVSRRRTADSPPGELTFIRYQFEKFVLQHKFLQGKPAEALAFAINAFMRSTEWQKFSVARMRSTLFTQQLQAEQEFESEIRRATHDNRFAALWDLAAEPQASENAS